MGCVEKFGYPHCYGALYYNDQCCCPPAEVKLTPKTRRLAELERRLEGALERIAELETAVLGESETEEELEH